MEDLQGKHVILRFPNFSIPSFVAKVNRKIGLTVLHSYQYTPILCA